jgi:hypothetical protein
VTAREKINAAVEDLIARGVRKTTAAPFLYRLFWRIGLNIRPPLYQGFFTCLVIHGGMFGLLIGTTFAITSPSSTRNLGRFMDMVGVLAVASGLCFGTMMALYFRVYAWRLKLPRWSRFDPERFQEEETEPDW